MFMSTQTPLAHPVLMQPNTSFIEMPTTPGEMISPWLCENPRWSSISCPTHLPMDCGESKRADGRTCCEPPAPISPPVQIQSNPPFTDMESTHCVIICPWASAFCGADTIDPRYVFLRLPRNYSARFDLAVLHTQLSACGPIAAIQCIEGLAGGFGVVLGGNFETAQQTFWAMSNTFAGKANMEGDELTQEELHVDSQCAGALIGEKGKNLRDIKGASGAYVEVSAYTRNRSLRTVRITGSQAAVQYARHCVEEAAQAILAQKKQIKRQSSKAKAHTPPPSPVAVQLPPPRPRPAPLVLESFDEFPPLNLVPETTLSPGISSLTSSDSYIDPRSPRPRQSAAKQLQLHNFKPKDNESSEDTAHSSHIPGSSTVPLARSDPSIHESSMKTKSCLTLLRREVSGRTFAQLHRACWCLLKDRIALISEIRQGVDLFRRQKKDARLSLKFGIRSKSWAHFVPDKADKCSQERQSTHQVMVQLARLASHDLLSVAT